MRTCFRNLLRGSIAAWALLACLVSPRAYADTDVPQAGANPIVFNRTSAPDDLIVLMAAASEHNSSLTLFNPGQPKHGYIQNFFGRTGDYMIWTINVPVAEYYHVDVRLSSSFSTPLVLTAGSSTLNFTTNNIGWDKLAAGNIWLPAGTVQLTLKGNASAANAMGIKSLELVPAANLAAHNTRVTAFKADTTWLSKAGYGLMFQYGAWGYPQSGTVKKSINDQATSFDVTKFVNMVKSTGASYVIWSASWYTYQVDAPIASINAIVGNTNRTSTRDLIGDVATALHAAGIRFMLYYHTGQDSQWGYGSTDFWQAQNWPAGFNTTGVGDRTTFFNNWVNIVSEIGNRYGTLLDGWFFDDGMVYYPAPFERLGQAARAGNPGRLVSYNPWILSRDTDFQDMTFGEGLQGAVMTGSAPIGGNGVFTSGPYAGLLQHSMFTMEQDWGVYYANQPINNAVNGSMLQGYLASAKPRNTPLSMNMMMWENGTVSQASLAAIQSLNGGASGGSACAPVTSHQTGTALSGGGGSNGAAVTLASSATNMQQQWALTDLGNGYVKVRNCADGLVLNGGGAANGYPVTEWADVVSTNLQWQVIPLGNGYVKLANHTDGLMLNSGSSTQAGAAVTEWVNQTSASLEWSTPALYYKIVNHASGLVLNGGGNQNGNAVTQWSNVSSNNLLWRITNLGNGYVKISNRTDGMVLNGGGGYAGYPVTEWSDVTSTNLQWTVVPLSNGYFKIVNRTDGLVLNSAGSTVVGSPVTESTAVSSPNLEWSLVPVYQ